MRDKMKNDLRDRRLMFREGRAFKFVVLFLVFAALLTFIVMTLWNLILPEVTGVKEINFWQAFGLLVLCKILFGGIHAGWRHKREQWKQRMFQKLQSMTPEEREKFKQNLRERCVPGRWRGGFPEDPGPKEQSQTSGSGL
jgi:hypothetical protein